MENLLHKVQSIALAEKPDIPLQQRDQQHYDACRSLLQKYQKISQLLYPLCLSSRQKLLHGLNPLPQDYNQFQVGPRSLLDNSFTLRFDTTQSINIIFNQKKICFHTQICCKPNDLESQINLCNIHHFLIDIDSPQIISLIDGKHTYFTILSRQSNVALKTMLPDLFVKFTPPILQKFSLLLDKMPSLFGSLSCRRLLFEIQRCRGYQNPIYVSIKSLYSVMHSGSNYQIID